MRKYKKIDIMIDLTKGSMRVGVEEVVGLFQEYCGSQGSKHNIFMHASLQFIIEPRSGASPSFGGEGGGEKTSRDDQSQMLALPLVEPIVFHLLNLLVVVGLRMKRILEPILLSTLKNYSHRSS